MPKKLMCVDRGQIAWAEYEDRAAGPGELRLRNEVGVEKHGTMMAFYKGYGNDRGRWDSEHLIHRVGEGVLWGYPIPLGNMQLGVVEEVGAGVEGWQAGDRAFYTGGFQPTATVAAHQAWRLREGVRWKDALLLDPAEFALGAVRDGNVRAGDRVAVFGLGAIGLTTVQVLRAAGAVQVIALDPLPARRAAAAASGADVVLDPTSGDAGLAIREATEMQGVDAVIDFSGARQALQAAFRGVGYGGTIVCGAFPPPYDAGLDLGGEAHMNRPRLVFSRACSDPNPDHPRWSHRRIQEACVKLIEAGKLDGEPILGPTVAFEELLEAYPRIANDPANTLKLTVTYDA